LSDIFDIEATMEENANLYVVIIGLADSKIGLIIDRLVGQEEIVIKSLGYYLKGIEGIAGATIRGDGKVTLIVDVAALMQMAKTSHKKVGSNKKAAEVAAVKIARKTLPSDYRVLIVDDSKTDRTIMKNAISPLGVTIVEAIDGSEALNIIKSNDTPFDACLIDIEMPKIDGYTLASEIRKYNKYRAMPLIAVTSRTGKTDRMRGAEVGMSEYITKPYSPDYLMNIVKKRINLATEA
ncbi:MAG TPA: response regulator, partial [Campylobacterales bacterium]|nr:response regulator [Campylobacterales bacterium]